MVELYSVRPTEDGQRLTFTDIAFQPWPKIARLNRTISITEKIDGTNAAIGVTPDGRVYAQSRTRIITPESDNFGFAKFVDTHQWELRDMLGVGIHFGEWWGSGIQRGYGLTNGERRFSLFNPYRWEKAVFNDPRFNALGVSVVPTLYTGAFSEEAIKACLDLLRETGSRAAPKPFFPAEGVVVFMHASGTMHKVTLVGDDAPKGAQE